jgi:hypothetical protein
MIIMTKWLLSNKSVVFERVYQFLQRRHIVTQKHFPEHSQNCPIQYLKVRENSSDIFADVGSLTNKSPNANRSDKILSDLAPVAIRRIFAKVFHRLWIAEFSLKALKQL